MEKNQNDRPGTMETSACVSKEKVTKGDSRETVNASVSRPKTSKIFFTTIKHFFPDFSSKLKKIKDPRNKNMITYLLTQLIWEGILMFATKLESRRRIKFKFNTEDFLQNINNWFKLEKIIHMDNLKYELKRAAHGDTLNYLLKKIPPEYLARLRTWMVKKLIRMRCFDKWRLMGIYYLICFDGTGTIKFKSRHCENCLKMRTQRKKKTPFKIGEKFFENLKEEKVPNKIIEKLKKLKGEEIKNEASFRKYLEIYLNKDELQEFRNVILTCTGTFIYYHPVLEAKLVLPFGIALSVETEFIENPDANVDKQDCELKAFYRLAKKLKKDFPRLRICLVLDSLYAAEHVYDICKKNNWRHIIVFKEGKMPAAYKEFESLKSLQTENKRRVVLDKVTQDYQWVTELDYGDHKLNVLECLERSSKSKTKYVWSTDLNINENNFEEIAKGGGRQRSKIENEGFNIQKNGGYELEHAYSEDWNAQKNFYLLLQIAHTINQLVEKGSLLKDDIKKVYGSLRSVAEELLGELRYRIIKFEAFEAALKKRIQIRFDYYDTS